MYYETSHIRMLNYNVSRGAVGLVKPNMPKLTVQILMFIQVSTLYYAFLEDTMSHAIWPSYNSACSIVTRCQDVGEQDLDRI